MERARARSTRSVARRCVMRRRFEDEREGEEEESASLHSRAPPLRFSEGVTRFRPMGVDRARTFDAVLKKSRGSRPFSDPDCARVARVHSERRAPATTPTGCDERFRVSFLGPHAERGRTAREPAEVRVLAPLERREKWHPTDPSHAPRARRGSPRAANAPSLARASRSRIPSPPLLSHVQSPPRASYRPPRPSHPSLLPHATRATRATRAFAGPEAETSGAGSGSPPTGTPPARPTPTSVSAV